MRSWASLPDATVDWKNYCNSEFEKLLQQLETGSRQQSQKVGLSTAATCLLIQRYY
jgi:hypothetical protein